MTLYEACVYLNLPLDNHNSDLYIKDSDIARATLNSFGLSVDGKKVSAFTDSIDNETWLEIPFSYDPYWNESAFSRIRQIEFVLVEY